jgi:hypothetical protein
MTDGDCSGVEWRSFGGWVFLKKFLAIYDKFEGQQVVPGLVLDLS